MASQKPSIPKGTRDFSPTEMGRREYIFTTLKGVFERYGYLPIETPAMENLDTLLGKYGEEGDRLLFKILNSGDFLSGVDDGAITGANLSGLATKICEKGLRYDLTVPFARYVVQHLSEITFPFKRYQVQPVWRADRPQKGRYREFYQCDVDVIGSHSLLNEVELIQIAGDIFERLGIAVTIRINNRKILAGLADILGMPEKFTDLTVALDKLEKIGYDNVVLELKGKGFTAGALDKVGTYLHLQGSPAEKLDALSVLLKTSEAGRKGIAEMRTVFGYLGALPRDAGVVFDPSLARGLNYYTGAIIEVKATDVQMGSLCGGGRYDDLTGIFGLPGVSGVGISFGADRIYDVLAELNRFPAKTKTATRVMFVNFGAKEEIYCLQSLVKLREAGINAELYPEAAKLKKQLSYADGKGIRCVVLAGENEIREGLLTVKDMASGEQQKMSLEELIRSCTNTNTIP
jgi:histidyl-tRNA synthetase